MAAGHGTVEDMTHEPQVFNFADNGFNLFELTMMEHVGTHIDAPLHFSADGQSVSEIPVSSLVAPLCVIDIRARAAEDPDAQVTPMTLPPGSRNTAIFRKTPALP